ncbi:MAG TPA: acetate--CoA ligase family protein, partial [Vitreimonas sp.]|nr:acetate--CoA ligase family protein [Vitreimonas sp.]
AVPQVLSAARVTGATVRGVLVQPMAPPGIELIIGARRDPLVGPVVLVGLGGVLAELIDDVAVGLAPLGPNRATALLERLRAAAVLDGPRGRPAVSRQEIARLLVAVGDLMVREPGIVELDLNPVVASPVRTVAVDALVVVNAS